MIPRVILTLLALVAVSWGALAFTISRQAGTLERVGKRIILGEPFKGEALEALQPTIAALEASEFCHPTALRAIAFIRLRQLEMAMAGTMRTAIDDNRILLREAMLRSLSCAPADPYLWLVLYWTDMTKDGFADSQLEYLRMSYRTGPREAWVALKRNRLALSAFPKLPADIVDMAADEFVSLVKTRRVYQESAETLRGPGWPIRDAIIPRLADLPKDIRQDFSNALYRAGVNVEIPGIVPRDPRPWR